VSKDELRTEATRLWKTVKGKSTDEMCRILDRITAINTQIRAMEEV
jgi:hypothetical protein